MSHVLGRVGEALRSLLRAFVGFTLLAIVLCVCIQVFTRYFLGAATPELAEISRLLFIWLTFAGSALLVSRRELITIDFVSNGRNDGRAKALGLLTDFCTSGFLVALAFYGMKLMKVVGGKIAPATGLPYVWFYASLVVLAGLGLFFILERRLSSPPVSERQGALEEVR